MPAVAPDLHAIQTRTEQRLSELRDSHQSLVIDSLTDENAAVQLRAIECEISECETMMQRISLALTERKRLDIEAERNAEAKRKAEAYSRAQELQVEREAAAQKVDAGAKMLAEGLHDLDRVAEAQRCALVEAGRAPDSVRIMPYALSIEAAIAYALREAQAPRAAIRLEGTVIGREAPLTESDIKPVEPKEAE
jgi:hypothetical protein